MRRLSLSHPGCFGFTCSDDINLITSCDNLGGRLLLVSVPVLADSGLIDGSGVVQSRKRRRNPGLHPIAVTVLCHRLVRNPSNVPPVGADMQRFYHIFLLELCEQVQIVVIKVGHAPALPARRDWLTREVWNP